MLEVDSRDTVEIIKNKIVKQGMAVEPRLLFAGQELHDDHCLAHYGIQQGSRLEVQETLVYVRPHVPPGGYDIGEWGQHADTPGIEALNPSLHCARGLASTFPAFADGWIKQWRHHQVLAAAESAALVATFRRDGGGDSISIGEDDLKVELRREEVEAVLGADRVAELVELFGGGGGGEGGMTVDRWVFRQVRARESGPGHCIKFHTDVSARTMHIRLNRPGECDGGQLAFVNREGAVERCTDAQATLHDWRLVHGVTQLRRGVRFGLFLIRE